MSVGMLNDCGFCNCEIEDGKRGQSIHSGEKLQCGACGRAVCPVRVSPVVLILGFSRMQEGLVVRIVVVCGIPGILLG